MGFSSSFRSRMNAKGANSYDRTLFLKQREFDRYFEQTIDKELVEINGIAQYAVIQDQNQNNNKDLSDDKYVVAKKDSNLQIGAYVKWRDKMWIVISDETKTVPTHKQGKVKPTNHAIKWMIGDRVSGNGQGYYAYVQNNTLYTLGLSTSGNNAWVVNAKMTMFMQDNDETRAIKIGQRVFIGGAVYQVMFRDYVSRKGLISFLLEEDFVNPNRDNIEEEITDYYTAGGGQADTPTPIADVTITGATTAKIGSTIVYETTSDITDWTVTDMEQAVSIVNQTQNTITLKVANNFQKVGSVVTIVGKAADGAIGSATVNIISPY